MADRGSGTTSRGGLVIALVITVTFLAVDGIGGLLAGSLVLAADAGHMATDVAALALAETPDASRVVSQGRGS